MAVDLYQGFTNSITGETFTCISYNKHAFRFDWIVEPGGYVPFEHVHLKQDEIFYVKSGELRLKIEDQEYIIGAGGRITVPRGRRHMAVNNKPSLLHCVVEYSPGLDSYTFFQCFAGLTLEGEVSKNGTVNIPKMLYFTRQMKARCLSRPTHIPAPLFSLSLRLFSLVGRMAGWKRQFEKYTGGPSMTSADN